jgi:heme/copper-type cytochrome/quinol oxidase subunit 2
MLTKEDENFLKYWSVQREKKRTFYGMASVGFRLGVFIVIGLALSLFAAKFSRKANPVLENNTSLIITVMIAGLAIVFFITYFSAQHKWDQNDLHYQELLRDKAQQDKMQHSGK